MEQITINGLPDNSNEWSTSNGGQMFLITGTSILFLPENIIWADGINSIEIATGDNNASLDPNNNSNFKLSNNY